MCVEIYNPATEKTATSPQELRDMLGIADLIMADGHTSIAEDCCLCQIDCAATVRGAGFLYNENNHDPMDVVIEKIKGAAATPYTEA